MSSSTAKKKVSCLSPKKKDSLNKEETTIISPSKRPSVKKRRTTELGSVPIPENDLKQEHALVLQVKLLSENATAPIRQSELAAGYDLASAYDCMVPARGRLLVQSDVAIAIPDGCYGRIAPRSGLAVKHGIGTGAGVIDADYRGSIGVLLFNHSDTDFEVKKGDRVAQLILERIAIPKVEVVDELPETERGDNGFGSTGIAADETNGHNE